MATGGWSSLPADLLKEVSARLSSDADHLHFHQVCVHWRASSSPPAAFRPWVLAGHAGWCGSVPISDYSLRLPRRGAPRMDKNLHAPPPAGLPYCCGTSRGWLALVDGARSPTRLVLWEPLSNTEIPLPCPRPLTRIFLSDDPLTSSNTWIAIATQLKGRVGQRRMLFWRPGDATWTMMYEEGIYEVDSVAFHQGKAYFIDVAKNIIICDLGTTTDGRGPCLPECTRIYHVSSAVNNLCKCDGFHPVLGVHLVTCNGELLLVVLRFWGSHPSLAEVYRPEWTPELHVGVDLRDRVMDLGDYSLFLGSGDTFALSSKEFPMIKRNCVYYALPCDEQHWISVYHLASNVVEEIPYPEDYKQDEARWTPYVWFCPRKPVLKHQELQAY